MYNFNYVFGCFCWYDESVSCLVFVAMVLQVWIRIHITAKGEAPRQATL